MSGEPLANYKRVIEAVHRITAPAPDGLGISQRTVTVSLHTPDDELRNTLVPVNTRWDVSEVLEATCGQLAAEG